MSYQNEIRTEITAKIVEAMKLGLPPWRKPWNLHANAGPAANFSSKKKYSGINPLLLELTAMQRGYTSRWWGTFKQWAAVGLQVSKRPKDVPDGEWGTKIVFWKPITKPNPDDPNKKITYRILRTYSVFNAEQVGGPTISKYLVPKDIPEEFKVLPDASHALYHEVDNVIRGTGASIIHGGNQACYERPPADRICLPARSQFIDTPQYYATVFHELVHWTEWRLDWTGTYAMGELIAEIGACFLESELKIPHCEDMTNHKAYLQDWLKELEGDPKAIFMAATQACKAVDYILSFSMRKQMDREAEVEGKDE